MGRVQDEFTTALQALMRDAGWMPTFFEGAGRRAYFGSDRSREWVEPDLWAVLRAVRDTPTVIAEIDTTPAGLEHNVAKYLWWANRHGCFWGSPSIIVSAFTESLPHNYALHETIARFLGQQLSATLPGTRHVIVNVRGESISDDAGTISIRLAQKAFAEIQWILHQQG